MDRVAQALAADLTFVSVAFAPVIQDASKNLESLGERLRQVYPRGSSTHVAYILPDSKQVSENGTGGGG